MIFFFVFLVASTSSCHFRHVKSGKNRGKNQVQTIHPLFENTPVLDNNLNINTKKSSQLVSLSSDFAKNSMKKM